jgi:hypothetical protein
MPLRVLTNREAESFRDLMEAVIDDESLFNETGQFMRASAKVGLLVSNHDAESFVFLAPHYLYEFKVNGPSPQEWLEKKRSAEAFFNRLVIESKVADAREASSISVGPSGASSLTSLQANLRRVFRRSVRRIVRRLRGHLA